MRPDRARQADGARQAGGAHPTDWRDTLAGAADLALLGIAVSVAAVAVLTAGAALAAGSAAARYWCVHRRLPPGADLARAFRRNLLPGLGVTASAAAAGILLAGNVAALRAGRVPGAAVLLPATGAVVLAAVTVLALALVAVGRDPQAGWWPAMRWAVARAAATPAVALLLVPVSAATLLAVAIPVTAPLVLGYLLFALHVLAGALPGTRA